MKVKNIVLVSACVVILFSVFYYFSFREKAINIELNLSNVLFLHKKQRSDNMGILFGTYIDSYGVLK
ncbi:hypothetical protein L323_11875 [Ruminiclostridium papyrosolvens C7]|uniref:Uncharacterized protein n=1 Tax=Ruminiclostridium papyrosolvens C7 TaxID=1330534 RepID=U4R0E7_9FIRM|nr:hypothetical protein L323_11875 [Ruminiclostridium papyrosolvens C7]